MTDKPKELEFDPLWMKDVCASCPRLLYIINSCPMLVGVRSDRISLLEEFGYNSKVFDALMVGSSFLNCVILGMIWVTLFRLKTTRSFCFVACQVICFILVNHVSKAFEDPRPDGSCTVGDFGMPSLTGTLCGSTVMWLLLESFQLPQNLLFKKSVGYSLTRTIYIALSPFVLISRIYMRYNTPGQVFYGYSIGSIIATAVFIFVKSTTLNSETIRSGLYPLWARFGLVNNMAPEYMGHSSKEDYLKYIRLKKQAEPLRRACEEMETKYHALNLATRPLFNSQKEAGFVSELMKNKELAAQYMTPEFQAEFDAKIDEATKLRKLPKKPFTLKGQFTDPDLSELSESVYEFMNSK